MINQPQVAILSTDGVRKRPVVVELPDGSDGIAIHPVGNLVMSWDHRAFDGAYAAAFLAGHQDDHRDPGLGCRAVTGPACARPQAGARICCGSAGSAGSATRTAWPCSAACGRRAGTTGCSCSSTRTCTPSGCGPRTSTSSSTRPRSEPSWSARDRGGDVTYHGPGQLVGYPIMSVPMGPNASPCHVHRIEQLVIDALADLGLPGAGRLDGYPGVWVDADGPDPRKICAIGVRVSRGRSMHGFALNVDPDMSYFGHIVPCGIADKPVTSLAAEGIDVPMRSVVDARRPARGVGMGLRPGRPPGCGLEGRGRRTWLRSPGARARAAGFRPQAAGAGGAAPVRMLDRRLAEAGVDPRGGLPVGERKPEWLRVKARMGEEYRSLRHTMRDLTW